ADAEQEADGAADHQHDEDRALGVLLEPARRDEGAHRHHGADREVDLAGDDDQRLADRNDAHQGRRQRHLLEVGGLQEARLAQGAGEADDEERQHQPELAGAQQLAERAAAASAARGRDRRGVGRWRHRRASALLRATCAAASRMASRSNATRANSAAMRPPRNTRMRSAMAITSSASSPIRMMAMPSAARCETMRWISAL